MAMPWANKQPVLYQQPKSLGQPDPFQQKKHYGKGPDGLYQCHHCNSKVTEMMLHL